MRAFILLLIIALLSCGGTTYTRIGPVKFPASSSVPDPPMNFHDLSANDIHGDPIAMDRYKGKKILVVNTASECGFTKQYGALQELYNAFKDQGLVVIGFPCNDFGGQEPGSGSEIEDFCRANYGITFPMMSKVSLKGNDRHPVYAWLCSKELNGVMETTVKWNFHKFLVDEEGRLVASYASGVDPLDEKILGWVEN